MKASSNYSKISPQKFAEARDSIKIIQNTPKKSMLSYRNKISYNTNKINRFSKKKGKI